MSEKARDQVPPTRRGQERREKILTATADLVASRGFHAVGVSDIGAAAGVTGAALYRHFENKTALLVAVFERAIDGLLDGANTATSATPPNQESLTTLIAMHIDFALRERSVLQVYGQESHNLPEPDRRRLRRKQRQYIEIWRQVLSAVHPALTEGQALVRVEAVFGLLNSVPNLSSALSDAELSVEFQHIAEAALHA